MVEVTMGLFRWLLPLFCLGTALANTRDAEEYNELLRGDKSAEELATIEDQIAEISFSAPHSPVERRRVKRRRRLCNGYPCEQYTEHGAFGVNYNSKPDWNLEGEKVPTSSDRYISAFTRLFDPLIQNDDNQCISKLLCEVAGGGPSGGVGSGVDGFLKNLLNLQPLTALLLAQNRIPSSSLFAFSKAAFIGMASSEKAIDTCKYAYPNCPNDPDQLLDYLNNHKGGIFRLFDAEQQRKERQQQQDDQNQQLLLQQQENQQHQLLLQQKEDQQRQLLLQQQEDQQQLLQLQQQQEQQQQQQLEEQLQQQQRQQQQQQQINYWQNYYQSTNYAYPQMNQNAYNPYYSYYPGYYNNYRNYYSQLGGNMYTQYKDLDEDFKILYPPISSKEKSTDSVWKFPELETGFNDNSTLIYNRFRNKISFPSDDYDLDNFRLHRFSKGFNFPSSERGHIYKGFFNNRNSLDFFINVVTNPLKRDPITNPIRFDNDYGKKGTIKLDSEERSIKEDANLNLSDIIKSDEKDDDEYVLREIYGSGVPQYVKSLNNGDA